MARRGDRSERFMGIQKKQSRNLKLLTEFYDEDTDVEEWSVHQYIFASKPVAAAAATAPTAAAATAPHAAPPAADGVPIPPAAAAPTMPGIASTAPAGPPA